MVQVTVSEGILEGEEVKNVYGGQFYSFKGIPYAEPPIGDLRFKAPQKKTPWDGVRLAKQFGTKCYQTGLIVGMPPSGSEDCLYLNVYTPELNPQKLLPVMFWIHGGGFKMGSGDDDLYGPEFLIKHGVILVTINYRLGVLGFLSLGTADIPGNAGMKDQVAAMRWVQKNIAQFGGDPDNVTIFGESAGAVSVSFHLASPMTAGLFKRAITQSGTSLCWASNSMEPYNRARALAKQLGCKSDDDKEIYEFFKSQPFEALINNDVNLTYAEETKENPGYTFAIVEEKIHDGVEAYWIENIYDVLRKGNIHEGIDVINGYTEDEGILYFVRTDFDKVLAQANKFPEFFVPIPAVINVPLTEQLQIGRKLRHYYLSNKDVTKENVDNLVRFFSFDMFLYSSILWQKMNSFLGKSKIYLYRFSCKSERNFLSQIYQVSHIMNKPAIVAHGDDLPYIFPFKIFGMDIEKDSRAFKMIEQVTKIWTNFAKYGNPTPDDSLGVRWTPYTLAEQHYMDIGEQLVLGTFPEKEDIEYWEKVLKEHYPRLVFKKN